MSQAEHAYTTSANGEAQTAFPDPRTIRRALGVVQRLPAEAVADLAERLIDQLDGMEADPDLEPEEDYCEADDLPAILRDLGR